MQVSALFEDSIPHSYRQKTLLSLFYRFYVHLCSKSGVAVSARTATAGEGLVRESAVGTSEYHEDHNMFPMTKAVPKNTAASQASGRLLYTDDHPLPANALFATIVKSPVGKATVTYEKANIEKKVREHFGDEGFDSQIYFDATDLPDMTIFNNGAHSNWPTKCTYSATTMDVPNDPFMQQSGADLTCDGQVIGLVVSGDRRTSLAVARFVTTEGCMSFKVDTPEIGFGDATPGISPNRKQIVAIYTEHPLQQVWKKEGQNPPGLGEDSHHADQLEPGVVRHELDGRDRAAPGGLLWPQTPFADYIKREGSDDAWLLREKDVIDPEHDSTLKGQQRCGLQTHFYMELWAVHAIPTRTFDGNDSIVIRLSAQAPSEVAKEVAAALEIPMSRARVVSGHLGGGFGGKTTRCKYMAVPIARVAWLLNRPVALVNELEHDITVIGNRHGFLGNYRVCFDRAKQMIKGFHSEIFSNAGNTLDCSSVVMTCALYSQDSCYNIPTFGAEGRMCFTNQTSSTAMRSFGQQQSILIVEDAIASVAHEMGIAPEVLREKHLYTADTSDPHHVKEAVTSYGESMLDSALIRKNWDKCKTMSNIDERRKSIETFNAANRWKKKGIAMIPIKYGGLYEVRPLLSFQKRVDDQSEWCVWM